MNPTHDLAERINLIAKAGDCRARLTAELGVASSALQMLEEALAAGSPFALPPGKPLSMADLQTLHDAKMLAAGGHGGLRLSLFGVGVISCLVEPR